MVALLVPTATYPLSKTAFGSAFSPLRMEIGLAVHWTNLAILLAIVMLWERRPLSSIGLQPVRWWTVPAGLIGGVAIMILGGILVSVSGLHADSGFVGELQTLPVLLQIFIALTAGIFEETLYRGYATERLATLWGNKWLAGASTVVLFTLAHLPVAGMAHILPVGIISVLVTLLYLWRRDLVLNIVAHATIDTLGLLLRPITNH
jgi:uncharacterized protein